MSQEVYSNNIMINTYSVSSNTNTGIFDTDVFNFLKATGIPGDTTVLYAGTAQEITGVEIWNAINLFTQQLKLYNLWDKFYYLYPLVGGSSTAHSKNLINYTTPSLGFSGGSHSGSGLTLAFSQYGQVTHTHPNNSNVGFGIYLRTLGTAGDYFKSTGSRFWYGETYVRFFSSGNNVANLDGLGLNTVFRIDNQRIYIKRNNSNMGGVTQPQDDNTADYTMRIGGGAGMAFNCALIYKSLPFINTELNTLYTIVQTLQTTLKRNV